MEWGGQGWELGQLVMEEELLQFPEEKQQI